MVIKPVKILNHRFKKMTDYDLTINENSSLVRYGERSDEIGSLSRNFLRMQKSLTELIQNITTVSEDMKHQSLSLSHISRDVLSAGGQLSETVDEVANGATDQAYQTSDGNAQLEELSCLIEMVQKNMKHLNSSTDEVEQIKNLGITALNDLVEKNRINNEDSALLNKAIKETSYQTYKIKEASAQIRDIASQTNLLALNASIESARAGDAGKGFAVVASEIGSLSQQTNQLTSEINTIIKQLSEKMNETIETIYKMESSSKEQYVSVHNTMEKFDEIAGTIQNMEEQCDVLWKSTEKMKGSKQEMLGVMGELSALSQKNAACMQEAAAAVSTQTRSIQDVSTSSKEVASMAKNLTAEIEKFKI